MSLDDARRLEDELGELEPNLAKVLLAIAEGSAAVASLLRDLPPSAVGTDNAFGDGQLSVDVAAQDAVTAALRRSGAVAVASSEEEPWNTALAGSEGDAPLYMVSHDPLDGSSVIAADWSVGSIFGVWPHRGRGGQKGGADEGSECAFDGLRGRDQVAAAYAVHGPRTVLVVARPRGPGATRGGPSADSHVVQEFTLLRPASGPAGWRGLAARAEREAAAQAHGGPSAEASAEGGAGGGSARASPPAARWVCTSAALSIPSLSKTFAPANLRAAADLPSYRDLLDALQAERFTLRYSGALVPDIHHILAVPPVKNKGSRADAPPSAASPPASRGGVFINPSSPAAPAKLRYLFEAAPMAFVVEAAGGLALGPRGRRTLEHEVHGFLEHVGICLGSSELVERAEPVMR